MAAAAGDLEAADPEAEGRTASRSEAESVSV